MPKREAILILPEGVTILSLDDPALLYQTLAEILGEHPNHRRNILPPDGTSSESPGRGIDDGPSPKCPR